MRNQTLMQRPGEIAVASSPLLPCAGLLIKEMTVFRAAAAPAVAIMQLIVLQAATQKSVSGEFLSPKHYWPIPSSLSTPASKQSITSLHVQWEPSN